MSVDAQKQGKFTIVNTNIDMTEATVINAMNGRQGDDGRKIYFALKDGQVPHNLTGEDIYIAVKDAAGKIKRVSGVAEWVSRTGGLFAMLLPQDMYQAAGQIQEAYIAITSDSGSVVSSIPITFTVIENNIIFTANASKDFIDTVDETIKQATDKINDISQKISTQSAAYDALSGGLNSIMDKFKEKKVASLNTDNKFTGINEFSHSIIAGLSPRKAIFNSWDSVIESMDQFGGYWYTDGFNIFGNPSEMPYANIHIVPGNDPKVGRIEIHNPFNQEYWLGSVYDGKIQKWEQMAKTTSRKVPFTDFNYVAQNMGIYAGNWYNDGTQIINGPNDQLDFTSIVVVSGNSLGSGYIEINNSFNQEHWIGSVAGGQIQKWVKVQMTTSSKAPFTDYAYVAKNMGIYGGNWYTDGQEINNAPEIGLTKANITIVTGNDLGSGRIEIHDPDTHHFWIGSVQGGSITGWEEIGINDSTIYSKDITFMGGVLFLRRTGKFVQGYIYSEAVNQTFKPFTTIAKNIVPDGFRPVITADGYTDLKTYQDSATTNGMLELGTDGSLSSRSASNGSINGWMRWSATWITKDNIPK
ncbi:BppU family phage baseplate upper protein [Leuconostoc citreum]|uniref:BppU family phage baseplate upper protein n=1 Tax=Leuconostoc citreum TaxID=33964 RepID=UPI002958DE78|nr:BppU family phage baseplate upper protein [Leuconostoc citreum]MDV8931143.1 phage baseplate upper protein [Leuconostoc citreum]